MCHGDPGPWNLVWRNDRLGGLIDWEYATVGSRRTDIAYALHYLVPFRDRSYWQDVLGFERRPRRRGRMQAFADGYGISLDDDLVDAVLASQRAGVQLMLDLAARGHPRYRQLVTDGGLQRELRAMRWGEGRRERFRTSVRKLVASPHQEKDLAGVAAGLHPGVGSGGLG